jgi:hypothetical protein
LNDTSNEEVFREMVHKLEFKKNIDLSLSNEELTGYFLKIDGKSCENTIFTTLKSFNKLSVHSEINFIKKLWEDMINCVVARYDDIQSRQLIHDSFDVRILNAYDKLIPGAFKSDIWRLCVLYLHGGVYSDVHIRPVSESYPLSVIDSADYIFCIDYPSSKSYIYNALMKSPKESHVIKQILDEIVSNVEMEYYPERDLEISGPGVHGKVLLEYLNIDEFKEGYLEYNGELFLFLSHKKNSKTNGFAYQISFDRDIIFHCRYNGYREELKLLCSDEHYSSLFTKGMVYTTSSNQCNTIDSNTTDTLIISP